MLLSDKDKFHPAQLKQVLLAQQQVVAKAAPVTSTAGTKEKLDQMKRNTHQDQAAANRAKALKTWEKAKYQRCVNLSRVDSTD